MRVFHAMRGALPVAATVAAVALFTASQVAAADTYRPLVLAYTESGSDVSGEAETVRERLEAADFRLLGDYEVSDSAHVVIATHDQLLQAAGSSERAAYIAPVRVAITEVDGQLQVSYSNPEYFRHAYRVEADVSGVAGQLEEALGAEQHFGSEDGLSERDLLRYRYTFGMERFDAPYELGSHGSRAEALGVLDANLAERMAGVSEVYRLDIPGQDATLIGVAIREEDGAEQDAADRHALDTVDVRDLRHTAYVPYEILVHGGEVEALHMRFRMALHFPDLRMLGDNSFIQLRRSPGVLEDALQAVAGGEEESSGYEW